MRKRAKGRGLGALVLLSLFGAGAARANGRFPRAERLIEHPTDPSRLFLAATYGLQVTGDRGQSWYHVCEAAFAFQTMYAGDPIAALTGDGSMIVATDVSVSVSKDQGCDWTQTLVSPASPRQTFVDFTVVGTGTHPIVAAVTTYAASGPVNQLEESTDNGMTWKPIGMPLPVVAVNTVDVDPTDATHIFATGLTAIDDQTDTGVFLTSVDHGASWSTHPIPHTHSSANPYIAAIHPTDPTKVFVRTDSWKDRTNVDTANDALLYTSDGGETWTELLHAGGPDDASPGAKLLGFALSPDGSTVLAGYGDLVNGSQLVEAMWFGVYRSSSDGKYSFGADPANPTLPVVVEPVTCITWTKTGIYVCASPQDESSFVSFTSDTAFTAATPRTKVMTLRDTKGVAPGCAGRAATSCTWSVDCAPLGACSNVAPSVDGGPREAGAEAATTPPGTTPEPSKGCGCRVPGGTHAGGVAAFGWLAASAIACARRRRERRRA